MSKIGYIKIWRALIENEIYTLPPLYLRVFERLILEANHQDNEIPYRRKGKVEKKLIKRGERLTSVRQISEWVGWYEKGVFKVPNPKIIKEILDYLVKNNMIFIYNNKGNRTETHYSIVNYNVYQDFSEEKVTEQKQEKNAKETEKERESNNKETNKKQTLPTNNNDKECIRMNKNDKECKKDNNPLPPLGGSEVLNSNSTQTENKQEPKNEKAKAKKTLTLSECTQQIQAQCFSEKISHVFIEWCRYKEERKEAYYETGFKSLCTQLKNKITEYGEESVCDVITESMANGWKGIAWVKLKQCSGKQEAKSKTYLDMYKEKYCEAESDNVTPKEEAIDTEGKEVFTW